MSQKRNPTGANINKVSTWEAFVWSLDSVKFHPMVMI